MGGAEGGQRRLFTAARIGHLDNPYKPGPPLVAWDLERNRESVRRLQALSPRIVYVGHGGPFEDLSGLVS